MHESAAARRKCSRQAVASHDATFQALNIANLISEPAFLANNEALRLTAPCQFSYQQFRLSLATAVTAGEIDVAD